MAGVTPRQIYTLLRQKGYTSVQAIGIMANMINESSLDPEAVAPGGASYGLVQMTPGSYPGASNLVTGNPTKDAEAQVNSLAHYVSPHSSAVAGNTPAEVAGNFAARFEKCAGCQPGQQQWNGRRANAATVGQWVAKGKWPTGPVRGGANNPGGGGAGTQAVSGDSCLIAFGGQHVGVFFGHGPTLPSVCLFGKTEARALIGGLLIGAGGITAGVGLAVLVAGAFSHTKAGQAAGKAVGTAGELAGAGLSLAGAPEIGAGVAAASHGVKSGAKHAQRKGQQKRTRAAGDDRRMERELGQPRENPDLRTGRGAIRETPAGTRRRQAQSRQRVNATKNGDREKVPF